jgi:hypothetical protein
MNIDENVNPDIKLYNINNIIAVFLFIFLTLADKNITNNNSTIERIIYVEFL